MSETIPLFRLEFTEADRQAADEVLVSAWITAGPRVEQFERDFAEAIGARHAVALSSCTAGLHMVLAAMGVGRGDEVIVPSVTFAAAANVVTALGATPVFSDIVALDEPNMCPGSVARLLGPRTKAVMPMHYAAYPCRMEEILALTRKAGVQVVEDSAHACITKTPQGTCGTLGDAGVFSFFSNKNLAVGQGGLVSTDDEELAERVRLMSRNGLTTRTLDRHRGHAHTYDVPVTGLNYQWDEIRAAIASSRLARLPADLQARRELARLYRELLEQASLPVATVFPKGPAEVPAHIFPVVLPEGADRGAIMTNMRAAGVQTSIHYPLLPGFSVFDGSAQGEWEVAETYAARVLTLPLFPEMSAAEVERVVDTLRTALEQERL